MSWLPVLAIPVKFALIMVILNIVDVLLFFALSCAARAFTRRAI